MNICFYTDQTVSGMTGGIGRVTDVLARHFRQEFGWKVYSIYGQEANQDCVRTELDGAICLRLHDKWGLRRNVHSNIRKAAKFINDKNIDCLIIQTSMDVAGKLRPLVRCRIFTCLHFAPGRDEWPWKKTAITPTSFGQSKLKACIAPLRNSLIHKVTQHAYRNALINSEKVVVLSPWYIDKYKEYCKVNLATNLIAIPNPLSFEEAQVDTSSTEKKNVILVVARMEERQKRISKILKMWGLIYATIRHQARINGNEVLPEEDRWVLKIVGNGPNFMQYQKMAKESRLKDITFEGRQDPIPYYKEASIFLMTSLFEGFPMTLLEAQQFGCVPVAFDSFAALRDVVTDQRNGIIIKKRREDAYIKAVIHLMKDKKLRDELSANGRIDCQRYNIQNVGEQWKKLLEREE